MASADRTENGAVGIHQQLQQAPHHFDFYQAIRRLECEYRDQPRMGQSLHPHEDPLRFGQDPSLAFANSTLASHTPGKQGRAWRLVTRFFGLLGPNGPLPIHLTEHARDRQYNAQDPTFVRFLDVFIHRFLSLFYRARAMAEPTFQLDRPDTDRFHFYVGALCGLGQTTLQERDALPDSAKLHFAGHFGCAARSALRLQSLLTTLLSVPAVVDEFILHWMRLPEDCRCKLGDSPSTGTLGVSAILGDRVSDGQHKFRVILGPMRRDDYEQFLPGGRLLPRVTAIVRNFIGDELDWDLQLILQREDVVPVELARTGRLGWSTWIGNNPKAQNAADLTLDPMIARRSRSHPPATRPANSS